MSLAKDAVDYDWSGWVVVSYGGNEYFARVGDVEQYVEIVDEKDKIYGKANADRVGGLVNVYADLSTSSEVIAQIVDGRKVEVLQTFEIFISYRLTECRATFSNLNSKSARSRRCKSLRSCFLSSSLWRDLRSLRQSI